MIFVKLILAHIIGDFILQRGAWVEEKERIKARSKWLYVHVAIHAGLTYLFLGQWKYWPIVLIILITHFAIDLAKLNFQKPVNRTQWFVADQFLHVAVIMAVAWHWGRPTLELPANWQSILWIYAAAICFLTIPNGIIIQTLMQNWSRKLEAIGTDSLAQAGKYIGILERLLVFIFILTDHWEGVGFLIAAKSVFRFGDLKEAQDRKLTEYILIGTLLSFGCAMLTALVVWWIQTMILIPA